MRTIGLVILVVPEDLIRGPKRLYMSVSRIQWGLHRSSQVNPEL